MTYTAKITWRAKQQLFLNRLFYTALDNIALFGHVSKNFDQVNHDIIIVRIVTAKVIAGLDNNKIIPYLHQ
jgi:hypothetical protein